VLYILITLEDIQKNFSVLLVGLNLCFFHGKEANNDIDFLIFL